MAAAALLMCYFHDVAGANQTNILSSIFLVKPSYLLIKPQNVKSATELQTCEISLTEEQTGHPVETFSCVLFM